jgi:hypothetical protein
MVNEKASIFPSCSTQPVHQPRVRIAGEAPTRLAVEQLAAAAFEPDDIARDRLRTRRSVELLLRQPRDEVSLLDRADFEGAIEPEGIDARAGLPVAMIEAREPIAIRTRPGGRSPDRSELRTARSPRASTCPSPTA